MVLLALLFALVQASAVPQSAQQLTKSDETHQLWSASIDPILSAKIQSPDQAYNEGEELMVPLHAAFQHHDDQWERTFAAHFARLVSDPSVLPTVVLDRMQYLYLASEFLVIAKQNHREDLIPPRLPDLLFTDVRSYWQSVPAWEWNRPSFSGGMRERILWKLANRKTEHNYYRAIVDDSLFLLSIAADLKTFGANREESRAWGPTLGDILAVAHRMYAQEGVFQPDGGWLFQPGVWSDHPDYLYSGNAEPRAGILAAPIPGLATDSSHSMRFPLWLTSFTRAYPENGEDYRFYSKLRAGLTRQFFGKVLISPSAGRTCYLLTNFMDGRNGVYRWNYESLGKNVGYGPYGLSGSALLGWWVFLDAPRASEMYSAIAKRFPWPHECLDFYLSPTTSATHPSTDYDPQSATLRLWHTLVILASSL